MCTGLEVMAALSAAATVATTVSAMSQKAKVPDVVRTDPVAEDAKARAQAEQEAQAAQIDQRRKYAANSLLSRAGAAGDLAPADTAGSKAQPKLQLGD